MCEGRERGANNGSVDCTRVGGWRAGGWRACEGCAREQVIVHAVVDEQHALRVAKPLPEKVDALRLAIHGAQLGAVVLREHGELDTSPPMLRVADPAHVLLRRPG